MTDAAAPPTPPPAREFLYQTCRALCATLARMRVTGSVPSELHGRPVIFASNHIGMFDPVALAEGCRQVGFKPRFLGFDGLTQAPMLGPLILKAGYIPVERRTPRAPDALAVAREAIKEGSSIAGHPEGRITLHPGLWPERGKTGLARLALSTGTPVIPVAQWGAHEIVAWEGVGPMLRTAGRALWLRPRVQVHFGAPIDLSDLTPNAPGDAWQATTRIMDSILVSLKKLRRLEPGLPRFIDPVRPVSLARAYKSAALED